jgi:hypothetical protein
MKKKKLKKDTYLVTIAVNLPAFAEVEVEATSQEEAMNKVNESFDDKFWSSPYYENADFSEVNWADADDLRVVS